jgi:hypothetical protein
MLHRYLRSNIDKVKLHLDHSIEHGYVLGIKMVRGAYLHTELDKQSLHVSKQQTDSAYDATVRFLLQQEKAVPWKADIMLATHNAQSVCKAFDLFILATDGHGRRSFHGSSQQNWYCEEGGIYQTSHRGG